MKELNYYGVEKLHESKLAGGLIQIISQSKKNLKYIDIFNREGDKINAHPIFFYERGANQNHDFIVLKAKNAGMYKHYLSKSFNIIKLKKFFVNTRMNADLEYASPKMISKYATELI